MNPLVYTLNLYELMRILIKEFPAQVVDAFVLITGAS